MNVRIDLAMAYHMGYEDALAKRMPDSSKAGILNSYNCTNGERTTTVDETERISISWQGGRHEVIIHVMECSECGRTYEHVNGNYEFCPHCGRRIVEVDE